MQEIVSSSLDTLLKVNDDISKSVVELLNYNFFSIFPNWSIVNKQSLITNSYEIYYYCVKSNNTSDTIEIKYERWAYKKSFKGHIDIKLNNDYTASTMKLPEKQIIINKQIMWNHISIFLDPSDIYFTNSDNDPIELRNKAKDICEYLMQLIINECHIDI